VGFLVTFRAFLYGSYCGLGERARRGRAADRGTKLRVCIGLEREEKVIL
jgi:hypothetical protein